MFHPLGMKSATYGRDSLEASSDWARPHVRRGRRWQPVRAKETYYRVPPAAGVNASITDMASGCSRSSAIVPTCCRRRCSRAALAARVHAGRDCRGSAWRRERVLEAQYALGWRVYDYGGHRLVFHAGAVQGYRGMIAMLPRPRLRRRVALEQRDGRARRVAADAARPIPRPARARLAAAAGASQACPCTRRPPAAIDSALPSPVRARQHEMTGARAGILSAAPR